MEIPHAGSFRHSMDASHLMFNDPLTIWVRVKSRLGSLPDSTPAPEYAISEMLLTSSDMYSLGILIFCVHSKGIAPYRAHGSISGMREHVDVSMQSTGMLLKKRPPGMQHLDAELQSELTHNLCARRMLTFYSINHITPRPSLLTPLPVHRPITKFLLLPDYLDAQLSRSVKFHK